MEMNETFAVFLLAVLGKPAPFEQRAILFALDRENRMHGKPDGKTLVAEFAGNRIEQERHVVVLDLDHGDCGERGALRAGGIVDLHIRGSRFAGRKMRVALRGECRNLRRLIAFEVFRRRGPEQRSDEIGGHSAGI
jgi:hypothetical protein